jgi:hypothetical protein
MKKLDDIIDDWRSTFGCHELEVQAKAIVDFLKSDYPSTHPTVRFFGEGIKPGWDKRFQIADINNGGLEHLLAMASLGYIQHVGMPKWCFTVTEKFIERCPTQPYEQR